MKQGSRQAKTAAAKAFVKKWVGKGEEQKDDRKFWEELASAVYGIEKPWDIFDCQKKVKFDGTTKAIDIYCKISKVVIEQKSYDKSLDKEYKQSDDEKLTPMMQGKRYYDWLDQPEQGRYIIACNFGEFRILDNKHKTAPEKIIKLEELPKRWKELEFVFEPFEEQLDGEHEEQLANTASQYIKELYHQLEEANPSADALMRHCFNVFCVRVVFCLFADDAGIFDNQQFLNFIKNTDTPAMQSEFDNLFTWLDLPIGEREKKLPSIYIKSFPYVDGGLFIADANYKTPVIHDAVRKHLLKAWSLKVSGTDEPFLWSNLSPTNFGCIFESTVDAEVRASGGMHYTTPENIHRVIDPLFVNDLRGELTTLSSMPVETKGQQAELHSHVEAYRKRLANIKVLDPACGSGNFLTETYKTLHSIEIEAIKIDVTLTTAQNNDPCYVSINQFYGIEIDDFAAQVARAALWIAECQCLLDTKTALNCNVATLPLRDNAHVESCDALFADWDKIMDRKGASATYIIGNPPFQGNSKMNTTQRASLLYAMPSTMNGKKLWSNQGTFDFVCAWYAKAAEFMKGKQNVRSAFVSTNSIVQGEQESLLWYPLLEIYNLQILFAWRTFQWFNKASDMAHVHCIIVALGHKSQEKKVIFEEGKQPLLVGNINGYLMNGKNHYIFSRTKPLGAVPEIVKGSSPVDGGNLLISEEVYEEFVKKEPLAKEFIHPFLGAKEFLNNTKRYCLWLKDASPAVLKSMPQVMDRLSKVRKFRLASPKGPTQKYADYPGRFMEIRQPSKGDFIVVPRHTSENRKYIPMAFISSNVICGDANQMIPYASLYHFGILESSIHMAWMRAVCGRLKSDYRYSNNIVYNNFPWPSPTPEQKEKIESSAQAILEARALFDCSTLVDLYDVRSMPSELVKAHKENDMNVMAVYSSWGITPQMTDEEVALILMDRSERMAKKLAAKPKKRKKGAIKKKVLLRQ